MTVDDLAIPLAVFAAIAVMFFLALMSSRQRRGGGGRRGEAQLVAAVEVERDVLRANHAVEVAALEGRLADAFKRVQASGDAAFRLKTAETAVEAARNETRAEEAARRELADRVAQLSAERDQLGERLRQVGTITAERDDARQDVAKHIVEISRLRNELQEMTYKLSQATAERTRVGGGVADVQAARAEAIKHGETAVQLRRELQAMRERLDEAEQRGDGAVRLAAELAAVREAGDTARRTLADRERQLIELRVANNPDELARTRGALAAAEERERAANENLSRLAYERDGLRNRLAGMERSESEAKAATEKHAALNELRQQKVYELEAKLRDAAANTAAAEARALQAEQVIAARDAATPPETARLDRMQSRLDTVRSENASLLDELEALRQRAADADTVAGEDGTTGTHAEMARLRDALAEIRGENDRLRAGAGVPPRVDEAELDRLRAELRTLAERFVTETEAGPAAGEPSLADKIRAFKAKRTASGSPAA